MFFVNFVNINPQGNPGNLVSENRKNPTWETKYISEFVAKDFSSFRGIKRATVPRLVFPDDYN